MGESNWQEEGKIARKLSDDPFSVSFCTGPKSRRFYCLNLTSLKTVGQLFSSKGEGRQFLQPPCINTTELHYAVLGGLLIPNNISRHLDDADGAVLLSHSLMGLQRLIQSFTNYCWEQGTCNYVRLKLLAFTKARRD